MSEQRLGPLSLALLRGQASRAWLFVFCIAVGVAARVSVGSFLASLDAALSRESRTLLSADLELSGGRPLGKARAVELRQLLPPATAVSERVSLLTMASAGTHAGRRRSRLVQLSAVDGDYPLVGEMKVEGGDPWRLSSADLQHTPALFAQAELLTQLGLVLGQKVRLGKRDFLIVGLLREEPGLGAGAFSLGPRALIGRDQVEATGLTGFGSRVSYETLLALPDPSQTELYAAKLRQAWKIKDQHSFRGMAPPKDGLRLRSTKDAQGDVRRFFERLADYLGLVSLMALMLGGVGVASVTRGFVRESAVSLGILRAMGASPVATRKVFALQALVLGLAGGLLGALAGLLAQALLPSVLEAFLPVGLQPVFNAGALAWGLFLGVLTAVVFGLEPVLASAEQSPASLLRDEEPRGGTPWLAWAWRAGAAVLFAGVAALEARSWTRGPGAFGALLLGALLLQVLGALLLPLLSRLRVLAPNFSLRHALANLGRAGLRPGASLVALGSAALLLGVLAIYQYSLLKELAPGRSRAQMPDLFIIDIQRDQAGPLQAFLAHAGNGLHAELSPMVKARYRGKLGAAPPAEPSALSTSAETREQEESDAMRSREQNLSWRPQLGIGETLAAGQWMDVNGDEVEASLEEGFATRLDAHLGDILRFDVQGVEVQAKVTSLRKVRWASFQPNFFILLSPWAIQDAPQTWIGSLSGAGTPAQRGDLQAALVQRFPNLTLFDVAESTVKILGILDKITGAIRLVAWFCLATGLVVLAGLALATARSRRGEAALLKVLGGTQAQLLSAAAAEFALLAGLASALGLALSLGFGWLLLKKVLEIDFAAPWGPMAALWLLFTLTGGAVGMATSWQVYLAKPAEVLRED